MNQRGQAAIETLVAAPIVAITLGLGGYLLYLSFARAWMTRSAREAAACLVTTQSESKCRSKLEATLATGLIFGRAEIHRFDASGDASHVEISFDAKTKFVPWTNSGEAPTRISVMGSFPKKI